MKLGIAGRLTAGLHRLAADAAVPACRARARPRRARHAAARGRAADLRADGRYPRPRRRAEGRGRGQARHRAARDDRQEHRRRRARLFADADDGAVVTARFVVGTSSDAAILRVHDKIRANLDRIPVGIPEPLIVGRGIDDVAIVVLTLSPKPEAADRWTANDLTRLARELQVEVRQARRHRPHLYRRRAAARRSGSSPTPRSSRSTASPCSSCRPRSRGANRSFDAGLVRDGRPADRRWSPARRCRPPAEIGNLLLTARDGRPVYVRDVADVQLVTEPQREPGHRHPQGGRRPRARPRRVARHRQAPRHQRRRHRREHRRAARRSCRAASFPADIDDDGHPRLRRDRQREGQRASLPSRPRHHLDHRPRRRRHRLARGDRGRRRHPDDDPAHALRRLDHGLHAQPRQPVRAHLLDRHPRRRRHRRDREHRPPLGDERRPLAHARPRSRPSPRSAIRPSSRRSPWWPPCCRCSSSRA